MTIRRYSAILLPAVIIEITPRTAALGEDLKISSKSNNLARPAGAEEACVFVSVCVNILARVILSSVCM